MVVLLPGWSVLPITRSTTLSVTVANQNDGSTLRVYEGRRRKTAENVLLAAFNLVFDADASVPPRVILTMSKDLEERCVRSDFSAVGG